MANVTERKEESIKSYVEEHREPRVTYKKKKGTSGITGQLYESRLLSLVFLRCLTDDEVDNFLLGSNVDGVGNLDDICLRFTYKSKQVAAFIQCKHRDNTSKEFTDFNLYNPKSKVNLLQCFDSYLQVLNKFGTNNDNIFNGDFKKITFHFVVYTSAVKKLKETKIQQITKENDTFNKVKQIICCNKVKHIISCKGDDPTSADIFQIAYDDQHVASLSNLLVDMIAKYFVSVINKNDVFINYANILVPDVITLTENDDYYDGSVNPNVFYASDKILIKLKNKIYAEILSKPQVDTYDLDTNIESLLSSDDKSDQRKFLSRLIVKYIIFDESSNKLTFNANVKQKVADKYGGRLKNLEVSKVLVDEAFEEAGWELLKSVRFKIPKHAIDIIGCTDIKPLFTNKINEIAKDFLGKLYFYTNQGQTKHVAKKVTEEITQHLSKNSSFKFTTQTDAFYLKFHDTIQEWWLSKKKPYFLTKTRDYLENLASEIAEPFVDTRNLSNKYQMDPVVKPEFHHSFLLVFAMWLIFTQIVDTNKGNIAVVSNQCLANDSKSIFGNITDRVQFNDKLGENVTLALSDMDHEIRNKILKYNVEFQGHMIQIHNLLNDYSVIATGILQKIIRNEAISISHRLSNSKYEAIKYVYVQRTFTNRITSEASSRQITARKYKLNTFTDMPRNINIITAEAGMGKSTILTHLSIETKKEYPDKWIVRMNLLDYCDEFEELGTDVNQTEFMKILLKSEFDNISKFSIKVIGGNVAVEYVGNDDVEAFSLRIMMDCYSKGDMIFLFDDFDEICPDYITPATNFIKYFVNLKEQFDNPKVITSRFQIWITSRPYNMIVRHLEQHFGEILTLEPLTSDEQHIFFEKYWSLNFVIQDITMEQFNNIDIFFEFMSQFSKNATDLFMIPITDFPLYKMYETAVRYFRNQIPNMPAYKDEILDKWIQLFENNLNKPSISYAEQTVGVPLYMNMAASYFVDEIKTNDAKLPEDWDLSVTTFNSYKRFVELQFKVRFEKKNGMKLSIPDVKSMYNKERQRFITMHKKLAFYALFHRSKYYEKLLTKTDRQDIESNIQDIAEGKEKTGLIGRIENKVPRFIHFSFAEYFAVEFIVDQMIDLQVNVKKCKDVTIMGLITDLFTDQSTISLCYDFMPKINVWLEFIVNYVLRRGGGGLLTILDQKLEHDSVEINEFLNEEYFHYIVLELLTYQSDEIASVVGPDGKEKMVIIEKSLNRVMSSELPNIVMFLLRWFDKLITKDDAKCYIALYKTGLLTNTAVQKTDSEVGRLYARLKYKLLTFLLSPLKL